MATIAWGNERAVVEFGHQLAETRLRIDRRFAERHTERLSLITAAGDQGSVTLIDMDLSPDTRRMRVLSKQGRSNHSARIDFWGIGFLHRKVSVGTTRVPAQTPALTELQCSHSGRTEGGCATAVSPPDRAKMAR